jgi:hypothetical protein
MNDKKWYVVQQFAEGYTYGVVALTDAELEAVKKFLDYEVVVSGNWSGGINIFDDEPYDTEEKARNAARMMA